MSFLGLGGGGTPADPLAGLALPPGDPAALYATAGTYAGMVGGLQSSEGRQTQAMGGVGQAWLGTGAMSCQTAVGRLGTADQQIGSAAGDGAIALRNCAAGWVTAKARWVQAQNLAAQAVADETAQRNRAAQAATSGSPLGAIEAGLDNMGLGYQSPLRAQAVATAQAAIDEFNQATNKAQGALGGAIRVAPAVSPRGVSGVPPMLGLGTWDPYGSLQAGQPSFSLYPGGTNTCTTGTGYTSSGFIVGPDGKRYPLVIPTVQEADGKTYNADQGTGNIPSVDSLNGADPGWTTTAVRSGIGAYGPKTGRAGKFAIAVGGLAGASYSSGDTPLPDDLGRLQIGPTGYPSLGNTGQVAPTFDGPPTDPNAVPGGGEADSPPLAGVSVVSGALGGIDTAIHANDGRPVLYQVTFQQNADGRTRALFASYKVVAKSDGHLVIHPSYVTGTMANGQPQTVPMIFRPNQEAALTSPQNPNWSIYKN